MGITSMIVGGSGRAGGGLDGVVVPPSEAPIVVGALDTISVLGVTDWISGR